MTRKILDMRGICMSFARPTGQALPVLKDIDLSIAEGEILGLLGRSGCGKSTLLRIANGLMRPTAGEVRYLDAPIAGPTEGIAMVFQTFALYPWLTVQQNVELGLDALGLPGEEERKRAASAIDLIGLDGFQSAYPRELSGGMRQRVGFARALVSSPTLLLMDEPFSALDVLTSETLRTDLLDLWMEHQLPTKAILLVTHNIEEAVLMCDRIIVLGSNPGHVAADIPVALPQPRNRLDDQFRSVVDEVYSILTSRMAAAISEQGRIHGGLVQLLPSASTNRIGGFIETLASPGWVGHAELPALAQQLSLEVNDLYPVAAALHILEFAELQESTIKLTAAGRAFAQAGIEDRKRLFREHLMRFVPLVAHMRQVLDARTDHAAARARFELELEDHLNPTDAEQTLRTAIGWGRFAELFAYDDQAQTFTLDGAAQSVALPATMARNGGKTP